MPTATKTKSVQLLSRWTVGTSVMFHVLNGEEREYDVALHADGRYSCINVESGETCKALQYNRKCYHVGTCQEAETVLEFGKHKGKKLAELPASYIRWLASHEKQLSPEHRHLAQIARNWHVSQVSEKVEAVVVERHTDELPMVQEPKIVNKYEQECAQQQEQHKAFMKRLEAIRAELKAHKEAERKQKAEARRTAKAAKQKNVA